MDGVAALCEILACPLGGGRLSRLEGATGERWRDAAGRGDVVHPSGARTTEFDSVWSDERGAVAYAERQGVLFLLPDLALASPAHWDAHPPPAASLEKDEVRRFYDEVGWAKDDDGVFVDSTAFVAQDPAARAYHDRCLLRVGQHLPARGTFLLDAASGPLPHREHLAYSEGFTWRVCVDFSALALREAQRKLGPRGLYLVADITRLPLRSDSMDAVISLHTIYHVPADQQAEAFAELDRVAVPEAPVVVAYNWGGHGAIRRVHDALVWVPKKLRKLARKLRGAPRPGAADKPKFYTHPHRYATIAAIGAPWGMEVRVLQSLGRHLTQPLARAPRLAHAVLRGVYRLEDALPRFFGRIGQYPLLVWRKRPR